VAPAPRSDKLEVPNAGGHKRVEQGEATRGNLILISRELFAAKGFAETGTEEIVRTAQVTRGALYHHFKDKEDLFRAVFENVEAELADRVVLAAARRSSPMEQLRLGINAFLDACTEPAVQRIVLQDGPTVLGWQLWHEIDSRYFFGLVVSALKEAIDAGVLRRQPVEPLAHVLYGAVTQAGMVVGTADDKGSTRNRMRTVFKELLDDLSVSA